MTTTQQSTPPPPTRTVASFELTFTVLGAVCGAVVPAVLTAGEAPDPVKLVGLALGAALPPLIGAARSKSDVGFAVVAVVTVAAIGLSWGGARTFATVTDTEPIVPSLEEAIDSDPDSDPDPDPGNDPGPPCEDPLTHGTEELGLAVCPPVITCTADGCGPVTVTSTGTAPLRDVWLEFEGDASSYLNATGCENAVLAKGEECTITLEFSPEKAPESATTELIIHQNLPKIPTRVELQVEGTLTDAPNLALGEPFCDLSGLSSDPDGVYGELAVGVPLSTTELPDLSSVLVAVYVDEVAWQIVSVDPNGGGVVRADYGGPRPGRVLVRVDPDDVVEESENETDNVAEASC